MRTNSISHLTSDPKRILKRQKRIIAPDYPFYIVNLYQCSCGCKGYYVTVSKIDLGYTKILLDIEYTNPLEAFIRFEKLVIECEEGKYDMIVLAEDAISNKVFSP